MLIFRVFFFLCFAGTALAGYHVLKHHERLFGRDPDAPSETGGSRMYGKMQALVIIAHALVLFGACLLMF